MIDASLAYTLLKGIIIGIFVSAPMGPIGLLCLRETIHNGRRDGLLTGLGATISDLVYGLIAYMGVGLILDFIEHYDSLLRLSGGVIILAFCYYLYKSTPKSLKPQASRRLGSFHGFKKVTTSFFFTLSNPLIILLFFPLYARFNFVRDTPYPVQELIVAMLGIVLGCLLWWFVITYIVSKLAPKLGETGFKWINYIIAIILAIIAILGIFTGLLDMFG